MKAIYNFLKNVWIQILTENKENKTFIPFLLLFISIPLPLGLNNICLFIFFVAAVYYYGKNKFVFSFGLLVPILFFLWMLLSYFWTIDPKRTLAALPKEIALLLVPLAFLFVPKYSKKQIDLVLKVYSYSIFLVVAFFLLRAIFRFAITFDSTVFFYHGPTNDEDTGLVPRLLNAIHVSFYVAVAFFYFFTIPLKNKKNYAIQTVLFVFVILLSSKNIIFVFLALILFHTFYISKIANQLRIRNLFVFLCLLGFLFSFKQIKNRFLIEFSSNSKNSSFHNVAITPNNGVHNISIYEAWNNESFTHNDFFPGTSFRVYQFRMFTEFIAEYPIFIQGFGLNASQKKLIEKELYYSLHPGYGNFNFHNQYVQAFAEIGFIGFLLLFILLFSLLKQALKTKNFILIAFTVLLISIFITESFLWRQRGVVFFVVFYVLSCHYPKQKLNPST